MTHNKNHHYLPQFYLRNFAADENGKSINLYNLDLAQPRFGASIAGQCYHRYFYGKDGRIEHGLGMLESAAAPVFKRMIADRKVPPRPSAEHGLLGQFISVQHGRIQARATEINEMADKFAKHILRTRVETDLVEALDHVRFSIENVGTWNVHTSAVQAPLLFDLVAKLLVAPTGSFFIVSDNPVVFVNQYLDKSEVNPGMRRSLVSDHEDSHRAGFKYTLRFRR